MKKRHCAGGEGAAAGLAGTAAAAAGPSLLWGALLGPLPGGGCAAPSLAPSLAALWEAERFRREADGATGDGCMAGLTAQTHP